MSEQSVTLAPPFTRSEGTSFRSAFATAHCVALGQLVHTVLSCLICKMGVTVYLSCGRCEDKLTFVKYLERCLLSSKSSSISCWQ